MSPNVLLLIGTDISTVSLPEQYKTPSTDIRHYFLPLLGIDEVREITQASCKRALLSNEHVFVILTPAITIEAQNALLKLFEEPPVNTIFYLIVPAESLLLPTLRSRFVSSDNNHLVLNTKIAQDFIKLSYSERFELIANKAKQKDLVWMEDLMTTLGQLEQTKNFGVNFKKSLLLSESYFRIRGASRKMLLEELALTLPVLAKL